MIAPNTKIDQSLRSHLPVRCGDDTPHDVPRDILLALTDSRDARLRKAYGGCEVGTGAARRGEVLVQRHASNIAQYVILRNRKTYAVRHGTR